jgi:hypothetical protein
MPGRAMGFRLTEEEEALRKKVQYSLQESPLAGWRVETDGHYERAVEELHHYELEIRSTLSVTSWRELIWPSDRFIKIHSGARELPLRLLPMSGFSAASIELLPT